MSHGKSKDSPNFSEYEAVLHKISEFSKRVSSEYAHELNCEKGCAQCCVSGLQVLPVEAAYVQEGLKSQSAISASPSQKSFCEFLDTSGACQIYSFRPLVCRTHGLPLKMASFESVPSSLSLRVLNDDVVTCQLNFVTDQTPASQDVLSDLQVQRLLHVVNARFCESNQISEPLSRVPLTRDVLLKDS